MGQDEQQAVMTFLERPATHGGAQVTRIDTHAAAVFLAGRRALKIKRAVKFPFLDFSTLAKRKAACEAEIEVNKPFAPAIYRGVVAITRANGGLVIGGSGEPVEWAVEMARFDEQQTLDHLAPRGEIDERLADALGRAVAKAHAAVPKGEGFAEELAEVIEQNDAELRGRPDLFAPAPAIALGTATRAAFARARPLIEARERSGFVRRCHGDLHLGNIVLIDGAPTLFDAIEFDPRIATGDVLYDLAFLLMDLIERKLPAAANIVFNRYLTEARSDDNLKALAALPLFLSLRAAIRAKVTAARAKGQLHSDKRAEAEQSARDYFALAQELLAPRKPQLIAVGGLSGTGKSWLARALAPDLAPAPGAVVLRSDVERKALFGAAENERLPQAAYEHAVTAKVYAAIEAKARRVLAAGHSAIADAVFASESERAAIEEAAGGHAFRGLFLTADLAVRVSRVGSRRGDASDADAQVARAQEQYDLGALDWTRVDASGTPEQTLERARAALA